jgi:hypothetical protein
MSEDFDFEPVPGLPEHLPKDEQLLWQGAPRWQDLAIHAFHVRKVIWYFVALGVIQALLRLPEGTTFAEATWPFVWLIPMGLAAAAILTFIAYVSARTTVYSITSKRVVMRIGIALPVTFNLPFRLIDGAALRLYGNGSGDIPLTLASGEHIAYLLLWPHARPFRYRNPQPCLRAIPEVQTVADLLAQSLGNAPQASSAARGRAVHLPAQAVAA